MNVYDKSISIIYKKSKRDSSLENDRYMRSSESAGS
jgi:hypothetical protein